MVFVYTELHYFTVITIEQLGTDHYKSDGGGAQKKFMQGKMSGKKFMQGKMSEKKIHAQNGPHFDMKP